MSSSPSSWGNRSVYVGGNVSKSAVVAGDHNITDVRLEKVVLPDPEGVDIVAEFDALRRILVELDPADRHKIENAFSDAADELTRPTPDKDEVGRALDRALDYAQRAQGFVDVIERLRPHVTNAVSWLGRNWLGILGIVGLAG